MSFEENSTWQGILEEICCTYIGQESLEDAAYSLAFVTIDDSKIHEKVMNTFEVALIEAKKKNIDVVRAIDKNTGCQVGNCKHAESFISEFRSLYLEYIDGKREFDS